ncbi:MAG: hypothetical protein HPPSJP_0270 [Candidatus Hepatoplasma scabrum]|nr:MAG: hypothetical protein HPPSJP_0270 [Candidatus Hepatoplasma sp.]
MKIKKLQILNKKIDDQSKAKKRSLKLELNLNNINYYNKKKNTQK